MHQVHSFCRLQICRDAVYFADDPGSYCVNKGRLDDTWLLGALGVLASHPGGLDLTTGGKLLLCGIDVSPCYIYPSVADN